MTDLPTIMPTAVDDATLVFPAYVSHLMPPMNEIPEEFREGGSVWNEFARDMFFEGLPDLKLHMVPGVDGDTAFRQLRAICGSFQPKHEHKEATIAYLSSLWFEKAETSERTYEGLSGCQS